MICVSITVPGADEDLLRPWGHLQPASESVCTAVLRSSVHFIQVAEFQVSLAADNVFQDTASFKG